MKKFFWFMAVLFLLGAVSSCKKADNNNVIIYTSLEDYRVEHMELLLKEKFPQYSITFEVLSTGNHAAKLKAEGLMTEADISLALETSYLEAMQDLLADLSVFDLSEILPEMIAPSKRYFAEERFSGAIVINQDKIHSLGLPLPASYNDLLNPIYKELISMPNPKTSSTAYTVLLSLVNAWGEDAAFDYFDKLAPNVLQFTTSSSGPLNALIQGEVAIGITTTYNAVNAINNRNAPLSISFFEEGAPFNTSGFAVIKGKENRPAVKDFVDFYLSTLIREDKELYSPEQILVNQESQIQNYPANVRYANMDGVYDLALKERLLEKWKY